MGTSETEKATFSFEHAMAHRQLWAAMSPLSRFSVLPYLIDPQQIGGKYLLNHQQAHWDMSQTLPTFAPGLGLITVTEPDGTQQTVVPLGGLALSSNPPLQDTPLDNPDRTKWWLFANHTDHLDAMSTLPLAEEWVFPFW